MNKFEKYSVRGTVLAARWDGTLDGAVKIVNSLLMVHKVASVRTCYPARDMGEEFVRSYGEEDLEFSCHLTVYVDGVAEFVRPGSYIVISDDLVSLMSEHEFKESYEGP